MDWNNFSLMSQIEPRAAQPAPTSAPAPTPAPAAAPQPQNPLQALFGGLGQMNPILGIFSNLFQPKKKAEPVAPTPKVIDQRPDDIQRLVSLLSNRGGM